MVSESPRQTNLCGTWRTFPVQLQHGTLLTRKVWLAAIIRHGRNSPAVHRVFIGVSSVDLQNQALSLRLLRVSQGSDSKLIAANPRVVGSGMVPKRTSDKPAAPSPLVGS